MDFVFRMKRLTSAEKKHQFIRRRRCERNRIARKNRQSRRVEVLNFEGEIRVSNDAGSKVKMPAVMCLDQNADETVKALIGLRHHLTNTIRLNQLNRSVRNEAALQAARLRLPAAYRDFEPIQRITPAAALVLASEYERIKVLSGKPPNVVNLGRWSRSVVRVLWEIGFFDIVGFPTNFSSAQGKGSRKLLRMRSGETADPEAIAELIVDLKGLYPERQQSVEDGMIHLYGAMIEAVGNVCGHAYPKNSTDPAHTVRKWWMTGAVDYETRRTTAVIYDQGISIPVSLPNWARYGSWKQRMLNHLPFVPETRDPSRDGEAILVALEEAVSSTGLAHRGHGLAQMSDFVGKCQSGFLRIMSRNGEVLLTPSEKPRALTRGNSIGGTLIEWNVTL